MTKTDILKNYRKEYESFYRLYLEQTTSLEELNQLYLNLRKQFLNHGIPIISEEIDELETKIEKEFTEPNPLLEDYKDELKLINQTASFEFDLKSLNRKYLKVRFIKLAQLEAIQKSITETEPKIKIQRESTNISEENLKYKTPNLTSEDVLFNYINDRKFLILTTSLLLLFAIIYLINDKKSPPKK